MGRRIKDDLTEEARQRELERRRRRYLLAERLSIIVFVFLCLVFFMVVLQAISILY